MSADDPRPGDDPPLDGGGDSADTQMFRAFVEREESAPVAPKGPAFQIVTLVIGLVVLAAVIYLLLKM